MPVELNRPRVIWTALFAVFVAMLGLAGSASAKLTGGFTQFEQCPYENLEVRKCVVSPTEGGEVVLGSKTVPIVNTAVLQGGFGKPNKETKFSTFYGAKNGVTLSKAAQPVPGGLAGLIKCNEIENFLLRASCEAIFENGLTGVNTTLELAQGAEGIKISEAHLAEKIGVAMVLPVKARLENPLLGSNCYVGSSTTPLVWEVTTGTTSPPAPNEPISGTAGTLELLEEGSVLRLDDAVLVDNAWAAPAASGCGGLFSFIIDPIINASAGLPSAAGNNTAILENTINVGAAAAVRLNDIDNP
jgi:hypothetical protein